MASFDFESKSGRYHVRFRYAGKPFKRSLKLDDDREARRVCGVVKDTIKDLKRGRLFIPEGADVGAFLISGGAAIGKPVSASDSCQADKLATIGTIFDSYEDTLTSGSKEASSIYTEALHGRHFKRVMGRIAASIRSLSMCFRTMRTRGPKRA